MDNCENCLYWLNSSPNPKCRRSPLYQIHAATDWCGEHQRITEQAAEASKQRQPKRKTT